MQGYIGLHRKLMENPVWSDPNYLKLWIYCLFKASHKEHDQLLGNQIVKIERGQFVTGRKVLAADMNKGVKPDQMLSEKSWERYLKNLEKWQMLTIKVTNKYSVVTIDNYDIYQSSGGQVDQVVDQQLTNKSPATDQQLTTNNNVKKGKNDKKIKPSSPKRVYDEKNEYYIIANFFVKQIRKNKPDFKTPDMQKWSNEIRLLVEKDEKDKSTVCKIIKEAQEDSFWFSNILSPSKLRAQFETLEMKFLVEGPKQAPKKGGFQKPEAAIKYRALDLEDM